MYQFGLYIYKKGKNYYSFFNYEGNLITNIDISKKKRFPNTKKLKLKKINPNLNKFILKCLEWDSSKRITVKEALKHEWIIYNNSYTI